MAASDARPVPRKNTAFRFYFSLRNLSTGALITTWTGADSEVSLDGAAFADCTNEATEIGTTGCGYIDLTASEMNADAVLYKLTVTNTNAETLVVTFFPEESGDYRADVTLISGDATAADNAEAFFDGTGYAGTNNVIPTVTTATNVTTVNGIAANAVTASALATDAVNEIVDAVWDEATSGHTTAGTTGKALTDATAPTAAAVADAVWDEALSGHLTAGSTGEALNAAGSAGDPWTTTLPGSYTGSQAGKMLSDILVDTGTTLQAELDGIQADTEDIQARIPAALVGGLIDASVGAMEANVLTASALATDAVSEIQSGLATPTNITAGTITTVSSVTAIATGGIVAASFGVGAINAAAIATDAIDADALAADAVTEIWAKAMTELTTVPGVTGSVLQALTWVFELSRNKVTQTATTQIVMRDDGSTTLGSSTVSDDGTTFTRGEFA